MVRSEVIKYFTAFAAMGAGISSFLINRAATSSGNPSSLGKILALASVLSGITSITIGFYIKAKYKKRKITIEEYQSVVNELSDNLDFLRKKINIIESTNQCA